MDQTINDGIVAMDRDVVKVSKWVISIVFFLFVQFGYTVWWAGGIDTKVRQIASIHSDVATALVVLADHGTELHGVRSEQARIRGQMDGMNKKMEQKTSDRFRRADFNAWKVEFSRYLEVRFERLEGEMHLLRNEKRAAQ